LIYDIKHETMDRKEMQALQLERLKKIVVYAYNNVKFYKKLFDNAHFDPYSLSSLEDIKRIPFTVKADLRDNYPYGLCAVPLDDLVRVHASSGTSGNPTVVTYTRNDLNMWSDCCARFLAAAGATSKDIVQISFGYGLFTGALGLHQGCEKLGMLVIPSSSGNTERQLKLLKDLQVTALVATPSYALYLGEMMTKLGYKREDFKLRLGFFGSEASSKAMFVELEEKLNVFPTDNYGLSEIIGPGVSGECIHRCGMHISEDHFYPELINPDTLEPCAEGELGELVLTTLTKEGMPIIRYRTKDLTTLNYSPCVCGRTTVRMSKLRGRTDDMLIIRGVNVFPSQIEGVLLEIPEVGGQYEIYVTRENHLDKLEVRVEVDSSELLTDYKNLKKLEAEIKHKLKTVLQVDAAVKLVEPLTLKRFEGKSKRVHDLRNII